MFGAPDGGLDRANAGLLAPVTVRSGTGVLRTMTFYRGPVR